MRCGRADRVELDAFLLGEAGDETIDAFRRHYPHCADCSARVADWMALEDALRAVMAEAGEPISAHPEPEDLARYAEAPARLGERAMRIENHLAGCASCADELRLITRFDPALLAAVSEATSSPATARAAAERGALDSLREALSGFVERLRGFGLMAPMPALAMALLLLAGLWWSGALERFSTDRPESDAPQLVESTPESGPRTRPGGGTNGSEPGRIPTPGPEASEPVIAERPPEPEEKSRELAATPAPNVEPGAKPGPGSPGSVKDEGRRGEAPVEIAAAEETAAGKKPTPGGESKSEPRTRAAGEPKASATSDEVLLAAVNELPPPSYATPSDAESMLWMRQFGAVRGQAPGTAHVRVRAPGNHTGLTLSRTPRLWWALDRKTDHPIQITIVEGDAIDPLVRIELPGPHAAGLHAFDVAKQGASLSPDVEYRWYVSIVLDPDRPSRNPVSAGSLRVADPADARRQRVGPPDSPDRGNQFAALGLWYDAFDFYASLAAAHPEVERLANYRDRLAEVANATP